MLIMLLSSCAEASNLWEQIELPSKPVSDLRDTMDLSKEWFLKKNEKFNFFHLTDLIILVLLIRKRTGLSLKKKHNFRYCDCLTFLNSIGGYIVPIARTASDKIEALTLSIKFLSSEFTHCFYKFTIWPFIEFSCHILDGIPGCYLDILDEQQKRIFWTIIHSLGTSLISLTYRQNVTSLCFFYRYYFGRLSSELPEMASLPDSHGVSTCYSNRLHDFSVTIPRC